MIQWFMAYGSIFLCIILLAGMAYALSGCMQLIIWIAT